MPDRDIDEQFLSRAIDLARQSVGLTSPNPCVGAVIVDATGAVVGTGSHTYEGLKHAEILALEQAGERAHPQALFARPVVVAFHMRVLRRFTGLDLLPLDLPVPRPTPGNDDWSVPDHCRSESPAARDARR